MTQFQAGATYTTRSICNHETLISVTVARRTAQAIVTAEGQRLRIAMTWDGVESVSPWGRYSMSPVITARDAGPKRGPVEAVYHDQPRRHLRAV